MPGEKIVPIQIQVVESQRFSQNSYVLWRESRPEAFVIDPGFDPDRILQLLRKHNLTLTAIVLTHGHIDHIAGNAAMKAAFPNATIIIGVNDAEMLTDPMLNLSGAYGIPIVSPAADRLVVEGDQLTVAGIELEVFDIPGHSPGHVVYLVRETTPMMVLGGDVLFQGSIGRTDFPGGSFDQLATGIRTKLWPLPDATQVFPGHGPMTTIGIERANNPFVGGAG